MSCHHIINIERKKRKKESKLHWRPQCQMTQNMPNQKCVNKTSKANLKLWPSLGLGRVSVLLRCWVPHLWSRSISEAPVAPLAIIMSDFVADLLPFVFVLSHASPLPWTIRSFSSDTVPNGFIGSRSRSPIADDLWKAGVPVRLSSYKDMQVLLLSYKT